MEDPVVTPHGHSFSRSTITQWLKTNKTCPLTLQPLSVNDLKPNYSLQHIIDSLKEKQQKESFWDSRLSISRSKGGNSGSIEYIKEQLAAAELKVEHLYGFRKKGNDKMSQIIKQKNEATTTIEQLDQRIEQVSKTLQQLLDAKSTHLALLKQLDESIKGTEDELEVIEDELSLEEKKIARLSAKLKTLEQRSLEEEAEPELDVLRSTTSLTRRSGTTTSPTSVWDLQSLAGSLPTSVSKQTSSSSSASSSSRSSVSSISTSSGDGLVYSFLGEFPRVWINTIHVENRFMYAGCSDSTIKVYSMSGKNRKAKLEDDVSSGQSYIMALLSDDKGHLWSGGADGSIKIWETVQNKLRCMSHRKNAHTGWVTQMELVNKNTVMPSLSFDDSNSPDDTVGVLKMNPNLVLFTAANDGNVKVWNPRSFKCHHIYEHEKDKILCISFFKNTLLTGSQNGFVTVWDANSQNFISKFTTHEASVSDMKVDTRTPTLWTCSYDCHIKVWDVRIPLVKPQIDLNAHTAPVKTLAFDHTAFRAFSGSKDGRIFLWDARTPSQPLLSVQHGQHGKKSSVLSLGLSSDHASLFSGGEDGRIVQWFCNLG